MIAVVGLFSANVLLSEAVPLIIVFLCFIKN
jgi:hypothetical protein